VILETTRGQLKHVVGHDGWNGDLNPMIPRSSPPSRLSGCLRAAQPSPTCYARRLVELPGSPEGGPATIGGIAQARAHGRMVPPVFPRRRRDGLIGQPLAQGAQRYLFLRVAPEQLPHGSGLLFHNLVACRSVGPLAHVTVAERSPGEHADRA